jgi:type IV secretion system protein VirD4
MKGGALSQKANEGSLHFSQLASDFNRGVFAHAIYTWPNCHMEDIYEMICGGDSMEALVADMKKARHIDGHIHPAVAFAVRTYEQTADRELSAFRNTAQRALRLWADPLVCRATSGSDFTLADVREASKPLSLYVSFPFEDQERLRPLSRLLIRQVLEESASRKDRPGEKRFPLFAVLDEFPTLGHFPILSYGLDYFLGMGVTMCLITPSMNRIHQIWGKDHPFLEGCATKVAFGMRDEKIARLFTGPIGMHPVSRSRTSTSRTGSSTSTEDHNEPLFSPQELMQLDDKKVLALIGNQHVILDKAPYYTNKKLLARSKMEIQP